MTVGKFVRESRQEFWLRWFTAFLTLGCSLLCRPGRSSAKKGGARMTLWRLQVRQAFRAWLAAKASVDSWFSTGISVQVNYFQFSCQLRFFSLCGPGWSGVSLGLDCRWRLCISWICWSPIQLHCTYCLSKLLWRFFAANDNKLYCRKKMSNTMIICWVFKGKEGNNNIISRQTSSQKMNKALKLPLDKSSRSIVGHHLLSSLILFAGKLVPE